MDPLTFDVTEYIIVYEGKPNDVSIFTSNEWKEIKEMSDLITRHAGYLTSDSDVLYSITPRGYKNDAYYLYYEGYEHGFSALIVNDYVLNENLPKLDEYETVNKFRDWITEVYTTLTHVCE